MEGRIHTFDGSKQARGLPEIGRLSIGEMAPGGNYPRALDHFRVYEAKPDAEKAFRDQYGTTDTILVSFFESDPARVCKQEFQLRVGKVRFAWGDGKQFWYWDKATKQNKMVTVSSLEEQVNIMNMISELAQEDAKSMKVSVKPWHQHLTLRLWLPEVKVPGEWVFQTKGEASSIQNITRAFDTILGSVGTVQGFPFELSIKIHKADNMTRSSYPVVSLRPLLSNESLEAMAKHKQNIFANVFESSLFVLSDSDISGAIKKLSSGDGVTLIEEPRAADVPGPSAEAQEAAMRDWGVEIRESSPDFNEALIKPPAEMSLADGIKYLKASKSLAELNHRHGQLPHIHHLRGLYKTLATLAIGLSDSHKQFVLLARKYSGLREDQAYKDAVIGKREAMGWKREDDNKALSDR